MRFRFHITAFCFILCLQGVQLDADTISDTSGVQLGLVDNLDQLGLKTGDLVFFQSKTFNGKMTQLGTFSPFTHSAMVVILEDETIALVHATDNDYHGFHLPLIDEKSRNGVILTTLSAMYITTNSGKSGFYKSIRIRKMDAHNYKRPTPVEVLKAYDRYKENEFEPSNFQFILSAFDLNCRGRDLLAARKDQKIMCSEFMCHVFKLIDFPFESNETANETTPEDIYRLCEKTHPEEIRFKFKHGWYHIVKN